MVFRKYEDFKTAIDGCGITAKEAEYAKAKATPNLVYFRSADSSIYADGIPVIIKTQIAVELYTERNDNASEKVLECWLRKNQIKFKKTERVWLTTENCYQTLYEFELMFNE